MPPRYCSLFELEPRGTLKECAIARVENFLHWMLKQQEDQYRDDLLASIESAPYHVVGLADCTRCLEADIRGRALRTVEDDEF